MKRDDIYYEAMRTRDHRFDGKFFVGVKTTGIYCRPICPAKPKRQNVEFFPNHLEAERAGYRPCLRCRPESAPKSPAWIGKSAIVQRAVKMLHNLDAISINEDQFAERFGVTARHLRRLFIEEIGKTPKQLAFENRLNLARNLIIETRLPITQIAFGSGFQSIRRFNDAFKDRFKRSPTEIRRSPLNDDHKLVISLAYRPPYDFDGLLAYYRSHWLGNLEWSESGKILRVVQFDGKVGHVAISNDAAHSRLMVEIDFPESSAIHAIIARVRNMFDVDSDPVMIANSLETQSAMKALLKKHSGIRLPSGWDPFEISIAAILGQLVSVEFGRKLVSDLIEIAGTESGLQHNGKAIKLFPTPQQIMNADLSSLRTTKARKKTLLEFSRAITTGHLSLEPTQDIDQFLKKILVLPGIGPWTASYIALKALRHTDAFPETDLILARALRLHPKKTIDQMSPWRGYAAALLWREYA